MRTRTRIFTVGVLFIAGLAFATSQPWLDLAARAARADRVVSAEVLEVRTELRPDGRPAFTVTNLKVLQDLKGQGDTRIQLRQLGGQSGAWRTGPVGDATFEAGERVVVFLACRASGVPCGLVGLGQGKLRVHEDAGKDPYVLLARPGAEVERLTLEQVRARLAGEGR